MWAWIGPGGRCNSTTHRKGAAKCRALRAVPFLFVAKATTYKDLGKNAWLLERVGNSRLEYARMDGHTAAGCGRDAIRFLGGSSASFFG